MKKNIAIVFALFLGFAFGGGTSALAYSIDSAATQLVPNVLQFKAIPGDKHVALSWEKPAGDDFSGVSIIRSDQNYLGAYDASKSIYKGNDSSFVDLDLVNNTTYYYTIFAYNAGGSYSSGSIAKATPKIPSITEPYQRASSDFLDTSGDKQLPSAKKVDKLELADFYYYLVTNEKVLQIGLDESLELRVTGGSTVLVEIPSDIFSKPINVISVSTDESSYLMTFIPEKNKYQLVISTPKNPGDSQLRFVAVFKDKTISDIKTKLIIESQGYVYRNGSAFLGFGSRQEMRIKGARVTIFRKEDDGWKEWAADKYFQKNPQITDPSGEFGFVLPKGEYYLKVNKSGFKKFKSEDFSTGPAIYNKHIELTPWVDVRLCILILFGVIIVFLIIFLRKNRKC